MILFEEEFPEEAQILMDIYADRKSFPVWIKKLKRFIPHYFPKDYLNLSITRQLLVTIPSKDT